jgi:Family of unknown function (DUF6152)
MATGRLVVGALALGLMSSPVFAHHGDAGRYDDTISAISGTVVALQLVNPHSVIVLDVTDDSGKTVRWQAEMGGAAQLARNFGWKRDTLKPGDKITLTGRRIKSGAPYFNLTEQARIVRTDTGEELFRTQNYAEAGAPAAAPSTSY